MSYLFCAFIPAACGSHNQHWCDNCKASRAAFNGNISTWDVRQVTNMNSMFMGCTSFGKRLDWDTREVTDMACTSRCLIPCTPPHLPRTLARLPVLND
jgi:surface protein